MHQIDSSKIGSTNNKSDTLLLDQPPLQRRPRPRRNHRTTKLSEQEQIELDRSVSLVPSQSNAHSLRFSEQEIPFFHVSLTSERHTDSQEDPRKKLNRTEKSLLPRPRSPPIAGPVRFSLVDTESRRHHSKDTKQRAASAPRQRTIPTNPIKSASTTRSQTPTRLRKSRSRAEFPNLQNKDVPQIQTKPSGHTPHVGEPAHATSTSKSQLPLIIKHDVLKTPSRQNDFSTAKSMKPSPQSPPRAFHSKKKRWQVARTANWISAQLDKQASNSLSLQDQHKTIMDQEVVPLKECDTQPQDSQFIRQQTGSGCQTEMGDSLTSSMPKLASYSLNSSKKASEMLESAKKEVILSGQHDRKHLHDFLFDAHTADDAIAKQNNDDISSLLEDDGDILDPDEENSLLCDESSHLFSLSLSRMDGSIMYEDKPG
ncbi:hypothetical protein BLNAU_10574 [Blattamonas nauphoetae]|uniref:Uncharacterized protein n=1 Tax=Blattamonas nauphoetae TaxID=2049346 RepID=A0ABQ9XQM9_9EUKA|nr:hypothetical protein BLNAU_10574 [Blattamonas nauphoetae]